MARPTADHRRPTNDPCSVAAPTPDRSRIRQRATVMGAPLLAIALIAIALIAIVAAGCLPSGTRGSAPAGQGSGGSGPSGLAGPSVPTSPTPRPPIVPPTPTPAPTFLVHVVMRGDSLNTIADRFGTTARSIAFWNRSTYPSLDPESATYRPGLLKIGWTLFLIPNDVIDEDALPEPSTESDGIDPDASDPADESAAPG